MSRLRSSVRAPLFLGALLFLIAGAPAVHAQAVELPQKELSPKTSEALAQLKAFTDAKDYAGALALADQLQGGAGPASFDVYLLSQLKAQVLLTLGRLDDAIAPLETALRLGEGNANFFDPAARLEQLNLLAQLHYQRAVGLRERAAQQAGYEKALALNNRWLELSPKPTAEARLFGASLLYQLATLDPAHTDTTLIRKALDQGFEASLLAPAPSSQLIFILVAAHIQLGENARAAELLESLAEREPKNAAVWSQLQSIYLAAAAEEKDPEEARRKNLRALLVLERAQSAGLLATPKDNYTRVAILFNLQQFTRAAELLETGLANDTLENFKRNWELLASAYQQTGREVEALDALTRAVKKFPDDGPLEFSLAQLLYNSGKLDDAYARGQLALAKRGIEKPGQVNIYLAYLAYELQRFEEAGKWVEAARTAGDVAPATLDPLARAVSEALRERANLSRG